MAQCILEELFESRVMYSLKDSRPLGRAVLGCRRVSDTGPNQLIRLRAAPFNIIIIQVYAPLSGHDEDEADRFYTE